MAHVTGKSREATHSLLTISRNSGATDEAPAVDHQKVLGPERSVSAEVGSPLLQSEEEMPKGLRLYCGPIH